MKNDLKRDAPLALKLSKKQQTEIKKMNTKVWDSYGYHIADYFLPYLINGDASELSNVERKELDDFEAYAKKYAVERGFTVGHWAVEDDSENIGFCDVCDKPANVATVKLMVYKDA